MFRRRTRRSATALLAAPAALTALVLTAPLAAAQTPSGSVADDRSSVSASLGHSSVSVDLGHSRSLGFVLSEAQFDRMFPDRDPFFTYDGLVTAAASYPRFAHTGSLLVRRQEMAAFLANVGHETGSLVYKVNQNPASYPVFCDATQPYGCPAGQDAYYGRGAIMLSWNFNYKAAGDALGLDLLNDPWLVEEDPAVAWATALWYWNTQTGPGTMTGHDAIVHHKGFGETIRSLNGTAECDGGNTEQMRHRVTLYRQFTRVLHTVPGRNVTC